MHQDDKDDVMLAGRVHADVHAARTACSRDLCSGVKAGRDLCSGVKPSSKVAQSGEAPWASSSWAMRQWPAGAPGGELGDN